MASSDGEFGVAESELKIGDRIYVQVEIKDKYQLAFHLAVEHTKQEIARLYEATAGVTIRDGKTFGRFTDHSLHELFLMDAAALARAAVDYQAMDSKK